MGRRLRLVANVDGSTTVVYFDAAAPIGQVLGVCASMNVTPGTGVINGVRNQEGGATLACVTPWRRIEGNVTFENCH